MPLSDIFGLDVRALTLFSRTTTEIEVDTKSWGIRYALFSHAPMTKEGGRELSSKIRDAQKELEAKLRIFHPRPSGDAPIVSSFKIELDPGESIGQIM